MSNDKIHCCGLIDEKGMECLAYADDLESVCLNKLYKESLKNNKSCYFEVYLNQSQLDIFHQLDAINKPKSAAKALIQFGGDKITVPDSQVVGWENLSKMFKK